MSWCWTDERAAYLHASGAACRARAVSLDGAVLSGAVRLCAEDRDVANRNRAAALCAGVRSCRRLEKFSAALGSLSVENFKLLTSDNLYILSYVRSLIVALTSTAILLLIGYPVAYGMSRLPGRWQPIAMMLVIVPFWTSFLIRIYAWINVLQHDGLLNKMLLALGITSKPMVWLSTDSDISVSSTLLPFMILPLYATLSKMDDALLEAASDLGASRLKAFWLVICRCRCCVGAGMLLCFIPIVGEFVFQLAGSDRMMIGDTLLEFFTNKDWPVASAIAIVLLAAAGAAACLKLQRRHLEALAAQVPSFGLQHGLQRGLAFSICRSRFP